MMNEGGEMSKTKIRRLSSEWQKIIQSWEKSDNSQAEFCQSQGIALATFSYWRKKLRKEASFLEITPREEKSKEARPEIELVLPHGIVLRVRG
jgi:transposase-like protein